MSPIRFRWYFNTGFSERFSRVFSASDRHELLREANIHLPDVRANGLRGKLILQAETVFSGLGCQPFTEWRNVGPDALPIDSTRCMHALVVYKNSIFDAAKALPRPGDEPPEQASESA